jgi:hypothetical protein
MVSTQGICICLFNRIDPKDGGEIFVGAAYPPASFRSSSSYRSVTASHE